MAKQACLSRSTVSRAVGLKFHPQETFKLSTDSLFAEKARDTDVIYLDPPVKTMVLSVDENTQLQALDRTQPVPTLAPGVAERRTHDCMSHGTTSLFSALDIDTGEVIGRLRRRGQEFPKTNDQQVPDDLDAHLVMDNCGTHNTQAVKNSFGRYQRFHVRLATTSASCLTPAEQWYSSLTQKQSGSQSGLLENKQCPYETLRLAKHHR